MKKSELRQLIKEEIDNIMNTKDDGASGYGEVMRKLTDKMTGGRIPDLTVKNTMRPKKIEIQFTEKGRYYNITTIRILDKPKVKRPGVHSKKKTSQLKSSKNYKKLYNAQGK